MFRRLIIVSMLAIGLVALIVTQQQLVSYAASKPVPNGPLPPVPIPADNPQTKAKIKLGRQLFFEKRLSSDGTINCASCHQPGYAWSDPDKVSSGVAHKLGKRNSPTIIDAAYSVPQFWDGRAKYLEKQAVGPVQNPIEMDLTEAELVGRLKHIPGYVKQFNAVFAGQITIGNMAKAIASFERTIISGDSPYDKYAKGNKTAMKPAAIRGMKVFNGKGRCVNCHSGPYFSDSSYHNLGVGYKNGKYTDVGRYDVTKNPKDKGKFKTPTLRQVALTAPYMHDGSSPTLASVIDLYNRGGIPNPNLDRDIKPLNLTNGEKSDLIAYLKALTGPYPIVTAPPLPNPEITVKKLDTMMGIKRK